MFLGLVSKIEKNLSDHTEFLNYKNEMDAWIEKAQQVLDSCNGDDDIQKLAQQIETINVSLFKLKNIYNLNIDTYTDFTFGSTLILV